MVSLPHRRLARLTVHERVEPHARARRRHSAPESSWPDLYVSDMPMVALAGFIAITKRLMRGRAAGRGRVDRAGMMPIPKPTITPAGPVDLVGRLAAMLGFLESGLSWISALILALLLAIVLTSVGLRYLFGSGFIWSEELSIWLNVVLVAVGSPLAVTGALAMRFDVVIRWLPDSIQKIASIAA